MQVFGKNIFRAKKENHEIKNTIIESDHIQADTNQGMLANLKTTAYDLGNYNQEIRKYYDLMIAAVSLSPSISYSSYDAISILTIGALLSVLFIFLTTSSNLQPTKPPRIGGYYYDHGVSQLYNDKVKFYEPRVETLLVSSNMQELYRSFQ